MAGTAGRPTLHGFHGCFVGTSLGFEQVRVAFVATEHIVMCGMWEGHVSGILLFIEDIASVASGAIAGHSERRTAIMAGTTGCSVRHRLHRDMVAVVLGFEGVRMAVFTTERAIMDIVAKNYLADAPGPDCDVPGMAFGATASDAERPLSVVAGSAGLALFHCFHADMVAIVLLLEDLRVAGIAVSTMQAVAEGNAADVLGLY